VDRQLVHLEPLELDAIAIIGDAGVLGVDTDALAKRVSKVIGSIGVRVAVSNADYLQHGDGTPESGTRTVSGMWWLSHGDDTALVGGFIIDGLAMTVTTEGETESPLAEDNEILARATRGIASQYAGSEVLGNGVVRVPAQSGQKPVRVVVTRDYRIRRPQDLLGSDELDEFDNGRLGLAVFQVVGGSKALVVKHGLP
jgi:hypothetical protein